MAWCSSETPKTSGFDMSHAFISYVSENQIQVNKLTDELRKLGVEVWLDSKEIYPGTPWKIAIHKAIEEGNYFVACFSQAYFARRKSTMNQELNIAIEEIRGRADDAVFFIPVILDDCEMPNWEIRDGKTFRDYHFVKLFKDCKKVIIELAYVINE